MKCVQNFESRNMIDLTPLDKRSIQQYLRRVSTRSEWRMFQLISQSQSLICSYLAESFVRAFPMLSLMLRAAVTKHLALSAHEKFLARRLRECLAPCTTNVIALHGFGDFNMYLKHITKDHGPPKAHSTSKWTNKSRNTCGHDAGVQLERHW